MNRLLPSLLLLITLTALKAPARTPIVLELFTSEGCSSCPPADKLLQILDETQPFADVDLIVLSEHVDYWDGSAWKDPYSSEQFSERQRKYAERLRVDSVYTPQLVVDGRFEGVGNNTALVKAEIEKARAERKLDLSLTNVLVDHGRLNFRAVSTDAARQGLTFYVALAENNTRSSVQGGENGGRLLTHVAVVRSLSAAGSVSAGVLLDKAISLPLPRSVRTENLRVVAFLQAAGNDAIVGAAQIRLKDAPLVTRTLH